MCAECSAELFLALPRLVLLWYLADPAPREALLRMLLPTWPALSAFQCSRGALGDLLLEPFYP